MDKITYKELKDSAKENAQWEIEQRNGVMKYCNPDKYSNPANRLTIYSCLFYMNGVYAGRK